MTQPTPTLLIDPLEAAAAETEASLTEAEGLLRRLEFDEDDHCPGCLAPARRTPHKEPTR